MIPSRPSSRVRRGKKREKNEIDHVSALKRKEKKGLGKKGKTVLRAAGEKGSGFLIALHWIGKKNTIC